MWRCPLMASLASGMVVLLVYHLILNKSHTLTGPFYALPGRASSCTETPLRCDLVSRAPVIGGCRDFRESALVLDRSVPSGALPLSNALTRQPVSSELRPHVVAATSATHPAATSHARDYVK